MNLPVKPKQRLFWVLGFGAINLVLAAWLLPMPSNRVELPSEDSAWSLPELPAGVDAAQLQQQLRQRQAWGDETQAASASGPGGRSNNAGATPLPQAWRFAGVVQEGAQRHLLLQDPAGKLQRYAVTDPLPEGQRIRELYADRVELTDATGPLTWYLYPPAPAEVPR